jgi:lipopolysaccharide/colanic/teichoic acid biosynthesis glycosyltransferase
VVGCSSMTTVPEALLEPIGPSGRAYYAVKRGLDVALTICLGLLALPLLIVIALAIRLESKGPVLFRQTRVGSRRVRVSGGVKWELFTFQLVKLRTMEHHADQEIHREYISGYIRGDEDEMAEAATLTVEGSYKLVKDPRVTRVGRVIRSLSLDELPQLWNVLGGDMSLVGPRPPIDYEVELYDHRHLHRFAASQGLTGWWQVRGRATTGFEEMVDMDLDYISRQSVLLDLWILVRTVPAILMRKGAG